MALDNKVIRLRLKETFGSEQQESIAGRLNVTQGTVSKVLTGNQTLTLEMAYHIAQEYGVSVDWLLGLSDKRSITNGECSYTAVVEAILTLNSHGAAYVEVSEESGKTLITCNDPLVKYLVKKCNALYKADWEIFQNWKEDKLSLFEDKPILDSMVWSNNNVGFLAGAASTESHWLEVYETAKKFLDDYRDMMGPDSSPFSD